MKICAAQTRPIQGDIPGNITCHKKLIERAVADGAGLIIFPELSLTGYEPTLAGKFATHQDDHRFDVFQTISDTGRIAIGLGVPLIAEKGIDTAIERLSGIARQCSVSVLMSNCVGFSDGSHCAGKTSAWNNRGALLGQLNDADEGLVIFDTETQQAIERVLTPSACYL